MPKAELHIHIEGSLAPELSFRLAQRNGLVPAYPSVQALRAAYAFANLQSFLDTYCAGASVLRHEQDFFALAWAYIRSALDSLRVERIDHGVRCLEDPALLQRLAAERVTRTVCPLSNVKLRVFGSLAEHKLPALLDAGPCATLNSDDPAYFGGDINDNFVQTLAALPQLEARHAYALARKSFEASFAGADDKQRWAAELDQVLARMAPLMRRGDAPAHGRLPHSASRLNAQKQMGPR